MGVRIHHAVPITVRAKSLIHITVIPLSNHSPALHNGKRRRQIDRSMRCVNVQQERIEPKRGHQIMDCVDHFGCIRRRDWCGWTPKMSTGRVFFFHRSDHTPAASQREKKLTPQSMGRKRREKSG